MQNTSSRARLSKNVLEMKFMKKTKEKCEQEEEEVKRKFMFASELTDSMVKDGDKCVIEPSFVPCEDLVFGRFSYRGMNPEIEKLMKEAEAKNFAKYRKMSGISNKEMALRYSSLVGTMGKKFTSKREWVDDDQEEEEDEIHISPYSYKVPSQKNPYKFLKPQDDS